jgi:hypothetical protein
MEIFPFFCGISQRKICGGRIIVQTTFGLFVSSKIKVKSVKLRDSLMADGLLEKLERREIVDE